MSKKKETEASDAVLSYLNKQNRPYSAVDIFSNLHKEYGKTAVQRSLEMLASDEKIKEKVYGKQKVYAPLQEQFGEYDENEIKKLDQETSELQKKLKDLQEKWKIQETELRHLNNTLTTEDARDRLTKINEKCDRYKERIDKIKSADNHISPEEKDKIHKQHKENVQLWKKRKRMSEEIMFHLWPREEPKTGTGSLTINGQKATDILNSILEGYPKSKKQLIEDVGIETDEEYGAVIPT